MRTRGFREAYKQKQRKKMILIIFDHANACASMRSLVEIHNICGTSFLPYQFLLHPYSIKQELWGGGGVQIVSSHPQRA